MNIFQLDDIILQSEELFKKTPINKRQRCNMDDIILQSEELNRKTQINKHIISLDFKRQKKRCEICGSCILKINKARHGRSKKHKDAAYLWHDCFETIV